MKLYSNQNISENQRSWYRQRYNPSLCNKPNCGKRIVFLKDLHGNTIACDAVKKVVNPGEGDMQIMDDQGIVSKMDRRVGWPIHICKTASVADESIPLPTLEPIPLKELYG